jgi:hypothetical protein
MSEEMLKLSESLVRRLTIDNHFDNAVLVSIVVKSGDVALSESPFPNEQRG